MLFHSLFNLLGVLLMLPLSAPLVRFLLALARNATPAHAQGDIRRALQLGTVEHLQRAIGAFVSEVSRQQMHRDVSAQLPELLRIATHFDTLARVMHHIGQQRPVPGTHPGIENLVQPVFDAARAFLKPPTPNRPMPPRRLAALG